jgi:hypothetical protein
MIGTGETWLMLTLNIPVEFEGVNKVNCVFSIRKYHLSQIDLLMFDINKGEAEISAEC